MHVAMQQDWRERFRAKMEQKGYNPTSLVHAVNALYPSKKPIGRTAVDDILRGRSQSPGIDLLNKLCKVLGMTVAELLDGQARPPLRVPIIGEITDIDFWRPTKTGKSLPDILDLWTVDDDLVAVRVLENSMAPRYQRNDIVIGNRVVGNNADNYIGLPCIVRTQDEGTYVKVLTRGTKDGTYTLRSLDPTVPDIQNAELIWFAPVVAIMPQTT
jgi:transcriptional regulator with XRE-family HTH domain